MNMQNLKERLVTKEQREEFRIGPFTVGDLIALAGVVFMSGALWWRVASIEVTNTTHRAEFVLMEQRVRDLEKLVPSEYVKRVEYRQDLAELKSLMQRIDSKLDAHLQVTLKGEDHGR